MRTSDNRVGVSAPFSEDKFPDGLSALRAELKLSEIMTLIERTARWVDPATFKLLPIWYPEFARQTYMFKENWSVRRMNKNGRTGISEHKREGNGHANKALTRALGFRSADRPNWSCCHIWGVDDPFFQKPNEVVQDRRYYSCVANMVLLPTPLKAFTDAMPEVKAMLRICAKNFYGWHCRHEAVAKEVKVINRWSSWNAYPKSWPRQRGSSVPLGVISLNDRIRNFAANRLASIKKDLKESGEFYPRKEVKEALAYWKIKI